MASGALKSARDPAAAGAGVEAARGHWARLVSKFLDMGEPMEDAMKAAARIVAFARSGALRLDGEQETRRTAPPASGIRRRR